MKNGPVFTIMSVVVLLGGSTFLFSQDQKLDTSAEKLQKIDCTGTAQACKKPVKFLSKTASCVCFTCGYGTQSSKPVCTKSTNEAQSLANLAIKSGYNDERMASAVAAIAVEQKKEPQYGR